MKDFPLTGFNEVRYSEKDKKVIYEKVKLTSYRKFDFDGHGKAQNILMKLKIKENKMAKKKKQ